ncbi:hypothetical protein J6590_053736 [Homalodisca vitripennis]|nr:hypothetical protein J6590_053736 [Homalodisca vitripennis]
MESADSTNSQIKSLRPSFNYGERKRRKDSSNRFCNFSDEKDEVRKKDFDRTCHKQERFQIHFIGANKTTDKGTCGIFNKGRSGVIYFYSVSGEDSIVDRANNDCGPRY